MNNPKQIHVRNTSEPTPSKVHDEPTTSITADDEQPCVWCGRPTRFIDYCFEARLCSKECQDAYCDSIFGKKA